ncbi:high frequency lysogenization protein HflD [Exilibacterium tricleocarpae]|uniref:High frequency lysogenization protein HflD homolog n=1 Tax=Exilibacterium tricleocarpae TaxID=2591008 RepID=A0A545T8N6_9GAMM|nr:high frequency lysogenization protein HflD [Exilibacterium tricleocarpae]TQV73569.1 high frequency lysogenization protein HflD [Exilibacterium tricleocarpae]
MQDKWHDITIALAGVFQAAALVEQLAKTGYLPTDPYRTCIESLFALNPASTEAVFGGRGNLELGLKVLSDLLQQNRSREHSHTLRYVLGILHLQKKLGKQNDMLNIISSRLKQAEQQAEHFSSTHDNVIANLADVYTDTISTFRFRIQVMGDYNYLQQSRIANQVRALLFAGVRAATLWRQVGGNRIQLVLQRRRLFQTADALLKNPQI